MVDKCKKTTYTSAVKLTEDTWKCSTKKQKIGLLKALEIHPSWAETKTISEMVKRGGGLTAKQLLRLEKIYLERNKGKVTIDWEN